MPATKRIGKNAMKIYTKTGDSGETGLFAGPRVSKDSLRIEAYGTVDELNSTLGVVRAQLARGEVETLVAEIQNDLFALGAQLATPNPAAHQTALVSTGQIEKLERAIDQFQERLEPLREFVLPAGTPAAAALHLARTVCRRAERRVVGLMRGTSEPVAGEVLVYLNRLSDLLFVMARFENKAAGRPDEAWRKPS
jgi:cob(I)alamin adenosyltransferase